MSSILFDFDSTLVPCESLEILCQARLAGAPEKLAELERLTAAGMDGSLAFEASLRGRLAIARPDLEATRALGRQLAEGLSRGAAELVADLHAEGHEVWIVSGGFQEILLEVGRSLSIPEKRIHGVQCRWGPDGSLVALDARIGFLVSMGEGLRRLARPPAPGGVGVGDGATDLALRDAALVHRFVAYTEHARRVRVVAQADFEAANMEALGEILGTLLR
jgi:phosphoserine phosphatase